MEILDDQPANCNYEFFLRCRTPNYNNSKNKT